MLSDRLVSGRAVRLPLLLLVLTALFLARVVGQALVALLGVGWLPPMESWYSGLLPYPLLLPVQVLILVAQGVIGRDVWRGQGFFARYRPRAGGRLQWLAVAYALAMLIRLVVTRSHPIPVVFHWVLAAYLFTLGRQFTLGRFPAPPPSTRAVSGG
jgi:hypothetical protein